MAKEIPTCPYCDKPMEERGSVPLSYGEDQHAEVYVTLYQCPTCKRVALC